MKRTVDITCQNSPSSQLKGEEIRARLAESEGEELTHMHKLTESDRALARRCGEDEDGEGRGCIPNLTDWKPQQLRYSGHAAPNQENSRPSDSKD